MAAESHVDRSIMGPAPFVDTNVRGTLALLEACRSELTARGRPFRFLQVSTDEVYRSLGPTDPAFTEATPLAPNSPYSGSVGPRSEEHTSELQSRLHLVCRLLLEKKKKKI